MPVNTTVSLGGGPLSDSRRKNATAHQFQTSERFQDAQVSSEAGKILTNKPFKKMNESHGGKSGQSTGIYDGSNTNNFSS
jgi:hypothetical protein